MKRAILIGLGIWLAATLALRVAGQYVLQPTEPSMIGLLLAVSLPLMWWLPRWVLRSLPRADWPAAAIGLVAPGMLLDVASTLHFSQVFPNVRADAAALFGAWILFCNAVALASVLWPSMRAR